MEDHPADQLDVEVALPESAPAGLARERERLEQQVVERLAARCRSRSDWPALTLLVGFELELGSKSLMRATFFSKCLELLPRRLRAVRGRGGTFELR